MTVETNAARGHRADSATTDSPVARPTPAPKIATAPISWGISEVDGWGVQLSPERVLTEMRDLGYTATELGPDGFLPDSPRQKADTLSRYGLDAVGSFVPVILHDADSDPLPRIERELDSYAETGGTALVIAAVTGQTGYDTARPELTDAQWQTMFANLDRIRNAAERVNATASLHPHVGTMVETGDDVARVLAGSTMQICFDTGHLLIGGIDPVAFASDHSERISHTHLKDVSLDGMRRVKAGEISYYDAIRADILYRPLGDGDIDIGAIVSSLIDAGYDGWFVLEQDKVLVDNPASGEGPIDNARESIRFLRSSVERATSPAAGGE